MKEPIEQKIKYFKEASEAFKANENVTKKLINQGADKSTSIEIAYELQAGEYTKNFNDLNLKRNKEIHKIINKYINVSDINSVGVLGVGEAKNWIGYEGKINEFFGLELSFSRLRYAYNNLSKVPGINKFHLVKGDATHKVFKENCVDMSLTLHSIEPNGNFQGAKMLENAINSASKYTLLFEPDFTTAPKKMKERMIYHDYVRNIEETINKNNSIFLKEKFIMETQENEDNLTTCWILEKKKHKESTAKFACPYSGCELKEYENFLYSPETGLAFPWIGEWWCINKSDAIFIGLGEQEL